MEAAVAPLLVDCELFGSNPPRSWILRAEPPDLLRGGLDEDRRRPRLPRQLLPQEPMKRIVDRAPMYVPTWTIENLVADPSRQSPSGCARLAIW